MQLQLPQLPRLDLKRRRFELAELPATKHRQFGPEAGHYSQVIDSDAMIYVDGQPAGLYLTLPEESVASIRAAVQAIEYQDTYRTGGLKTTSRVFGFQPRITVRRDFCAAAALAHEEPAHHLALTQGAALSANVLRHYLPDEYARQAATSIGQVRPEWLLPGSFYTSGIVNWNNLLRYHFDAGNFPGTWNTMLTFKKDIEGGMLSVPELDAAFAVRDGTLAVFNAQGLMHGVTPFKKKSPRAYRYTVVYYALSGMCKCGSATEELERIRSVKTEREQRRRSSK